jgi:hypothetical protein
MDLKKIIIQTLNEYEFGDNLKNGDYIRGVKKMYFNNVAETIINKLAETETLNKGEGLCNVLHSTDFNGKCFNCNLQVFTREPKV